MSETEPTHASGEHQDDADDKATGSGESGGGAYPNPHTGHGEQQGGFMGHGGQGHIDYSGPGDEDDPGEDNPNAVTK